MARSAGSVTRVHRAWIVAATAFVALVMASGFRSTTGVLLIPLHDEFGWSHGAISVAVFVNLVCFGLAAPFAAALVERFGLRRVVSAALATIAAGSLLTLAMTELWQLILLWGVVNGAATGAVSVPLAAIVANRWFVARRGLVTGLLSASYASGQLIFLPLLAWMVGIDWRWAALTVAGAAVIGVLPLVIAFLRDRPADLGLLPYGATEAPAPPPRATFGASVSVLPAAFRSRTFWVLTTTFFVCGATTSGLISTHLIPAAHDHGITEVAAASLLALIGVFDIVGTTASGWLTDRFDARRLLVAYYLLRGLSLLALPAALGSPELGMLAFAVVYGLDWVATVPPTSALTTARFGVERAGILFAWIFAAHQLGAAVAAFGAGAIRTETGEYGLAFAVAGVLAIAAAGLMFAIRRRAPRPAPAMA
jgi:MFS family permease